jgi:hypothetical protein
MKGGFTDGEDGEAQDAMLHVVVDVGSLLLGLKSAARP